MKKNITVGMDMGDKNHSICVFDKKGQLIEKKRLANTAVALKEYFHAQEPCLIAIEAGTHSGWVSRELEAMGHEVLVSHSRKLRAIWQSDGKDDERDAEMLGRLARFDRRLLCPMKHRGVEAQKDLAVIKARDMLVRTRARLVAHARGAVKSIGGRISPCSTGCFHLKAIEQIPIELSDALSPVVKSIEELTKRIRHYEQLIAKLGEQKYPQTHRLGAITGVGPITSLAFVLTLEESSRFKKSREVGAFLGLTPRRDKSGQTDKQLRITKAGNSYLRRLLVGSAQYILGPFGPDCDLRRFGLKLAERGGKNAKRRAVIAVARKLAVLMHQLWESDEAYEPLYQEKQKKRAA